MLGDDIHFGFNIVNFPRLSDAINIPRLPPHGIYISHWICLLCAPLIWFSFKNLQITYKLKFVQYRFKNTWKRKSPIRSFILISYISLKGSDAQIVSSPREIKRLRRPRYDPGIIENAIGLVLSLSTATCRLFLKNCILTNIAVGTTWQALSKHLQRRNGPVQSYVLSDC